MTTTAWPSQSVWVGLGILLAFALVAATAGAKRRWASVALLGGIGAAALAGGRLLWVLVGVHGPVRGEAAWWSVVDVQQPGFASFGAIWGGAAVAAAALRVSDRLRVAPLLDVVVPASFVGLAAARFGCLPAGCDFGARTSVGWAIRYPAGTEVWQSHVQRGLVEGNAMWSAPVHPFPLYLVGATLASVLIGWWIAVRVNPAPGVRAVTVATAYLLGRLVFEWFRAPAAGTHPWGTPLGLNQWFALATLIAVGFYIGFSRDG